MAPKPAPDDGQQSPHPVQPPYGATHPPGITHKEIAGIPFWGALAILVAVIAVVAIAGWIVRYPLPYPPSALLLTIMLTGKKNRCIPSSELAALASPLPAGEPMFRS